MHTFYLQSDTRTLISVLGRGHWPVLLGGQLCSTPEVRQTSSCSDILANLDYWTVSIDVLLSLL